MLKKHIYILLLWGFTLSARAQCNPGGANNTQLYDNGIIEVTGFGQTQSEAYETARTQLAYTINSKINAACTDVDKGSPERSSQACTVNISTIVRSPYTPIVDAGLCTDHVYVKIRADERVLANKLDFTRLSASADQLAILKRTKIVPFALLLENIQAGSLSMQFDVDNRVWKLWQEMRLTWVAEPDIWKEVSWEGCSGGAEFALSAMNEPIHLAYDAQLLNLYVNQFGDLKRASLWELDEELHVTMVGVNLELTSNINRLAIKIDFPSRVSRFKHFLMLLTEHAHIQRTRLDDFTATELLAYFIERELMNGRAQLCGYKVFNKNAIAH